MHFSTIFGQNLQFFNIFLSSNQSNPVGIALSYQLRNVALMLSVFKTPANKDVMSFELSTRVAPDHHYKTINKMVSNCNTVCFTHNNV